jgi:hypothetical protein
MPLVKISKLNDIALRYAVAVAEGYLERGELHWGMSTMQGVGMCLWTENCGCYDPVADWEIGGPLIDKHKIWLSPPTECEPLGWDAEIYDPTGYEVIGKAVACPTALVAVCRAVVMSKFGSKIDIPDWFMP